MRLTVVFALFFIPCLFSRAQNNLYDFVNLGGYQVGFMDTLVLDGNYNYNGYDYKGQKPYFVQIWHPTKMKKNDYLTVKEFFTFKQNIALKGVQEQLTRQYRTLFIRDYLTENLLSGETNHYSKYTFEDVLDSIGSIETRSVFDATIGNNNYPVIIYYNGSQGHPFENFAMAEYFASRGYLFIAASFELPFEQTPFGLLPYDRFITDEEEKSLKAITEFVKSLTESSQIFFVGHSMGAQMGLRTFGRDSTIKGMVSLETSIEFTTDIEKIKTLWPEVYQTIMVEKVNYPFPILFCAATGAAKPFNFLENVQAPHITYASTTTEFEHNAYLSCFYLRYFLGQAFQQSDVAILEARLQLYVKHLELMYSFIDGILNHAHKTKTASILIQK